MRILPETMNSSMIRPQKCRESWANIADRPWRHASDSWCRHKAGPKESYDFLFALMANTLAYENTRSLAHSSDNKTKSLKNSRGRRMGG